jgi:hypothetical protein
MLQFTSADQSVPQARRLAVPMRPYLFARWRERDAYNHPPRRRLPAPLSDFRFWRSTQILQHDPAAGRSGRRC